MKDDIFYEIVAKELRENKLIDALWLKAMVEARNDRESARILYIKLRVEQLREHAHDREEQQRIRRERGWAECPECGYTGYMRVRAALFQRLFSKRRIAACPRCGKHGYLPENSEK